MKIDSIISFVRSHGFSASIINNAVSFQVPYSIDGKHAGYDNHTVTTFNEARIALGY